MSALRIAVLGAGFMGSTHARAWQRQDGIEIAAIHARTGQRAEPLAAEVGSRWVADLDAILTDDSIVAVDITLPTPEHRAATEAALAAGKHVLLEKPLALSLDDAEAIVRAAEGSDRTVMVAHVLRFWPEYIEMNRLIEAGAIGTPRYVTATRRQPTPDWTDGGPRGHITGGSLHDMLIHDFDAVCWVLGQPVSVHTAGVPTAQGVVDQAQVLVRFADGAALIDGGSTMPESYPFTARFEVLGDDGAIEYHFRAGGRSFEVGEPTNVLTLYRNSGEPEVLTVPQADAWDNEIAAFAGLLRDPASANRATPADALTAMRLSLAAQESVRTGGPVEIAP